MQESHTLFTFCFDLNLVSLSEKIKFYLPTAYISKTEPGINYLDKKASPDVLKSLNISIEQLDKKTQRLLALCDALKTEFIFNKYSKNFKGAKSISDLLEDKKIEFGMKSFITNNLNEFYNLICDTKLPISLEMGADKAFAKNRLITNNPPLDTKLNFRKHSNGISYGLYLINGNNIFSPSNHKTKLLVDFPAWVSIDNNLFQIKNIDSKKLTPFLKNKTIEIPTKTVPQYFSTFIKDIAKKTEIEADGFDAVVKNTIIRANLQPVHDFFKDKYFINIMFDYDGYMFDNSKSVKMISRIDDTEPDNIKVVQYKRNTEQELIFEEKLLANGFEKTGTGFYDISNGKNDSFENIQWIIDNIKLLKKLDFSTVDFNIDGKKILTKVATISSTSELHQDWFDMQITIEVGKFKLNFIDIIQNIKRHDNLYKLPDDTYFVIPEAWFSTYEPLVRLGKIRDGSLWLPKSNFTILDDIPTVNNNYTLERKADYKPSDLVKAQLRPYQLEGVNWLLDHYYSGLGACLADDMGLGKTIQTLTFLVAVQEQWTEKTANSTQTKDALKALVVLPSSLVFNWYNEATKFTPHFSLMRYAGKDRRDLLDEIDNTDLIFTTYNFLRMDIDVLQEHKFSFLILDESQYIKNKDSKVFQAISKINSLQNISLSGTPIENSLDDLWSQMQFINPNILGSYKFFADCYKKPIEKQKDEPALEELRKIISPFILRRTKEQVLDDLPAVTEQIFYCDMEPEQERLYEREKSKARNTLLDATDEPQYKIMVINTLMRLRQLSNHPKIIDANSEIDSGKYFAVTNYLETLVKEGKKTIIFSSFVSNLGFYEDWCVENNIPFCEIIGATSTKIREDEVQRFQTQAEPLLFFISLKAGGVGLNLTKASYVLFLDPWWNPFAESQGIGRAHRIGQLNKVNVLRFITRNTVEEKIIKLQENKRILSDSLLSEDFVSTDIEANLNYILE